VSRLWNRSKWKVKGKKEKEMDFGMDYFLDFGKLILLYCLHDQGGSEMQNKEEWKIIKEFPKYSISSHGRVKRLDTGLILKLTLSHNGYFLVHMGDKKIGTKSRIHRLVLDHFISPRPTNKHEANHKDFNKKNNHVSNLEWVTRSENMRHLWKNIKENPQRLADFAAKMAKAKKSTEFLRNKFKPGEQNPSSKLTNIEISAIRSMKNNGLSPTRIASIYLINKSTVHKIVTFKRWKHVQYTPAQIEAQPCTP
jgi:hypothetical protein